MSFDFSIRRKILFAGHRGRFYQQPRADWARKMIPTILVRQPLRKTPRPSRAEKEAEERVSLSADRILDILQQEPGLLLQVKKMLVRKAFEQGRLLDPADLTDETLFRLVREDENIRILATREIEDRSYIRAKPTKEEIERERDLAGKKACPRRLRCSLPQRRRREPIEVRRTHIGTNMRTTSRITPLP